MKKRLPVSKEVETDPTKARFILDTVILLYIIDGKVEDGANYILNLFQEVETKNLGIKELLEQDFEIVYLEDEEFIKEAKQLLEQFLSTIPQLKVDINYRPGTRIPLGEEFTEKLGNILDIAMSLDTIIDRYSKLNDTFKHIINTGLRTRFPNVPNNYSMNIENSEVVLKELPPMGVRPMNRP